MNLLSFSILGIVMAVSPTGENRPELLPQFDEVRCAWRATHIVIADEGALIDGQLSILRSLKGDLGPGDQLQLPELAQLAEPKSRTPLSFGVRGGPPIKALDGKRMLLYLRKTADGWKGAGWGDQLLVSFAWLEPEGPFARRQFINPGPLGVMPLQLTTEALIAQSAHIVLDHQATSAALKLTSPELQCSALHEVLLSGCKWNRERLASLLMKTEHPSAIALIRHSLEDDARIDLHPTLLWAVSQTNPVAHQPLLFDVARRELEFWSSLNISPTRFEEPADQSSSIVKHYLRTHTVLSLLNEHDQLRQAGSVPGLIEFWDQQSALDQWLRPIRGFSMLSINNMIRSKYPKR